MAVSALVLGTAQAGAEGTTTQARTSSAPQRASQTAPAGKTKEAAPAPAPAPAPKATTPAPAAKPAAPAAPAAKKDDAVKADDAAMTDDADKTEDAPATPAPAALPLKPASVDEVIMLYQRVGHGLAELENHRGLELCATLRDEFRAIKLSLAIQTAEARAQTAWQLAQMQVRIERLHGVEISKACQNSPLAPECL